LRVAGVVALDGQDANAWPILILCYRQLNLPPLAGELRQ
jgi:hypothetical protein